MVLIGELVKALMLYSNSGAAHHSNMNNNSSARVASKKFWMQKAQSNWVFLTWTLCFISLFFVTILLYCFFFSFFLGFALHNIYAFHAKLFLLLFSKKKKKERKMYFTLFFLDLKSRLAILSLHNMFMYLV